MKIIDPEKILQSSTETDKIISTIKNCHSILNTTPPNFESHRQLINNTFLARQFSDYISSRTSEFEKIYEQAATKQFKDIFHCEFKDYYKLISKHPEVKKGNVDVVLELEVHQDKNSDTIVESKKHLREILREEVMKTPELATKFNSFLTHQKIDDVTSKLREKTASSTFKIN